MSFLSDIIGWIIGLAVMAFVLVIVIRLVWQEIEILMDKFNKVKGKKK